MNNYVFKHNDFIIGEMYAKFFSTLTFVCLIVLFCNGVNGYRGVTRVVGGTATTIERYPILAQLLLDVWGDQNFIQHCAGVILTARHVLSAAHCFQYSENTKKDYSKPKYWKARVGSSLRTAGGSVHSLKSIINHPSFDKYFYTNDIAIVVVVRAFKFGPTVRQGTITTSNTEITPNAKCNIVGWGTLQNSGHQPIQLQHASVYTVDQETCKQRYSTIPAMIANSMMCAGRLDIGGVDGCFGDSGGPLIFKGLVVGLVSFGYSCGHPFYPGVYTKISHYTEWILQITSSVN